MDVCVPSWWTGWFKSTPSLGFCRKLCICALLSRIDFFQVQPVSRKKLQLVGITALLLASKYEEMFFPNIEDFVYITDNAYTSSQIREMETLILKELKFELGRPLPLHFLRRASKAGEVSASNSVGDDFSLMSYPETLI